MRNSGFLSPCLSGTLNSEPPYPPMLSTALHYTSVKAPSGSQYGGDGQIFGLQVAVLDWLKAWMRHSKQEKLRFLISDKAALEEIQQAASEAGADKSRLEILDSRYATENFRSLDVVFRADPDPRHILWQRNLLPNSDGGAGFAFCGLAHAISGMEGGQVLEQYCLAPSAIGDAIVCPSRAVRSAITRFWEIYGDYLERRFAAKFVCPVSLPVIPLGTDIDRMAARISSAKRRAQREALGLRDGEIAVLWVGRLSHAIKAHPIAMFRAVEDASLAAKKPLHLVMQGYFVPKEAESQFRALAADICKTAKVTFVASGDPRFPDGLWAGADIFLSLVDNLQESFGLTPIEAIAAGLPRVISDWDGYRDCVADGEDGFLIRTIQPPAGAGGDLSALLLGGRESYGGYLAKAAQTVAVDHHMAAAALAKLALSPDLRHRMAENALKRLPNYEWSQVISAYESLWSDLAEKRKRENGGKLSAQPLSASKPWPSPHPHAPDPFDMYAAYPTMPLGDNLRVSIAATTDEIAMLWRHEINVLALDAMLNAEEIMAIIKWIAMKGVPSIGEIRTAFAALPSPALLRGLAWLIKLGILVVD